METIMNLELISVFCFWLMIMIFLLSDRKQSEIVKFVIYVVVLLSAYMFADWYENKTIQAIGSGESTIEARYLMECNHGVCDTTGVFYYLQHIKK